MRGRRKGDVDRGGREEGERGKKTEKERKEKGGCRQRKRGRRKWDVDIEREEKL